jgi:hypothetical protein
MGSSLKARSFMLKRTTLRGAAGLLAVSMHAISSCSSASPRLSWFSGLTTSRASCTAGSQMGLGGWGWGGTERCWVRRWGHQSPLAGCVSGGEPFAPGVRLGTATAAHHADLLSRHGRRRRRAAGISASLLLVFAGRLLPGLALRGRERRAGGRQRTADVALRNECWCRPAPRAGALCSPHRSGSAPSRAASSRTAPCRML